MPRVTITLPEELGAGSESGRVAGEATRDECGLDARADGAGEPEPVIVRWFATWARGDDRFAEKAP